MINLIDIDKLATELATATEQFCNELFSKVGNGTVYGIALCTVDDLVGIYPKASTETEFGRRRAKLLSDEKKCAWLAGKGIDLQRTILGDERWSPYEWEYGELADMHLYAKANEYLESTVNSLASTTGWGSFGYFTAEVHAATAIALKIVRDAGVFDTTNMPITAFCSKHASSDAVWLERESARFLNAPDAFEQFRLERIDWITDDNHDDLRTAIFCEILSLWSQSAELTPRRSYEWWRRLEKEMASDQESIKALFSGKRPRTGPPCPKCGEALRTQRSQRCISCGADWH